MRSVIIYYLLQQPCFVREALLEAVVDQRYKERFWRMCFFDLFDIFGKRSFFSFDLDIFRREKTAEEHDKISEKRADRFVGDEW